MSQTSIAAFDNTVQTTSTWLNELGERLSWTDRRRVYRALAAVLHALRDHLTVEAVAAFGAQLPMLVRGMYYEGWHPHGKPVKERKKGDFLAHVSKSFRNDPDIDAEEVACAVFQILAAHVTTGEIENIKNGLPHELRALWSEGTHTLWT